MIRLSLDREVQSGNALAYRHWRHRMRDRDAWLMLLRLALSGQTVTTPTAKRRVSIHAYRGRTLDTDNLSSGCKHLRDAIVRVGLLVDDNPRWAEFSYRQSLLRDAPGNHPCTVVEVQDAPEESVL